MTLTVRQRARRFATFRFVEARLMETLARWVPTTGEMEAKILFGRHIWDHAQHADALGKRVHELRAPLHHMLEPGPDCLKALDAMARLDGTAERIHACYEITLKGLEGAYRSYLDATDLLMDAPSVRVVTAILVDVTRMADESRQLLEEVPALKSVEVGMTEPVLVLGGETPGVFMPAESGAPAEAS